jgi:hypothetical protein
MARWSMPEVESAIKAAFLSRAAEGVVPEALRFTELRDAIRESRPISDRTLSKGVKLLVQQDALKKRVDGSYERTVKIERQDKMDVIVASDKLSVDAGAAVGLVGEQAEGWTYYGVPLGKPRHLRPRLRRAAISFQEEVDDILWGEAKQIVILTLANAKGRGLTPAAGKEIKRILMDIFDFWESMRFEHLDAFAWMFIMEKIAPGAFPRLIEKLLRPPTGVLADIKSGVPIHQSMVTRPNEWIPYMAKLFSEDEATVKAEWPKLTIEAEGGVRAFETLRRHLTARDWTAFNKHWSSIVMARYWLCAVVR